MQLAISAGKDTSPAPKRGKMHVTGIKRARKCMQVAISARKETGSERGIKHVISARRAGKRTRASHDVTA